MTQRKLNTTWSVLIAILFTSHALADDPLPAGLDKAIENPNIPSILDVTILKYNEAGHGEIKVNAIHKRGPSFGGKKWVPPKVVRGYGYVGSDKIAPLKIVAGGQTKRFLVFLDGDLLYSTYNNRFPIREGKKGVLEVGIGFNGGGGPWLPLNNIVQRIAQPAKPQLDAETDGIERQYVKRAVLSKVEEKIVIELAQKRGIKTIAKIYTYNLYPTAARGIGVQGIDKIKGREVSYNVLNVKYEKWWHPNEAPRKGDLQIGDFWAGRPNTRKQTILKVGRKEYRTSAVQGLSIEQCESILERFLTGKYALAPGARGNVDQIDWSKPQGFRKRGDSISVSFLHKGEGSGFFDLEVKLIEKELTVTQILQAVP
jgi:hypothetical protein